MADYPYTGGGELKIDGAATTWPECYAGGGSVFLDGAADVLQITAYTAGGIYSPTGKATYRIVRSTFVQVHYSKFFFKNRRRMLNV